MSLLQLYPRGCVVQTLQFDFFNYAGIHRKVSLYAKPKTYVDDITIVTDISGTTGELIKLLITFRRLCHFMHIGSDLGVVRYSTTVGGNDGGSASTHVGVLDRDRNVVAQGDGRVTGDQRSPLVALQHEAGLTMATCT
jgi:beta-glucuronidase